MWLMSVTGILPSLRQARMSFKTETRHAYVKLISSGQQLPQEAKVVSDKVVDSKVKQT